MKFWDTSALVPLVLDEPAARSVRDVLTRDREMTVWLLTTVELLSVFGRLGRQAAGMADLLPGMRSEAIDLIMRCEIVANVDAVRRRAERLVGVHPLAAADAMQLAAALVAAGDRPERLDFVTLDTQLARCAQLEGFRVIGHRAAS